MPVPAGTTLSGDDVGGVIYPRTKVSFGIDGVATDVDSMHPLPVNLITGFATDAKLEAVRAILASAPLPAGAATDAKLDSLLNKTLSVNVSNSSVPVTGTFWQANQPVSISNASLAVTGTFWQATQPISVASLPLPAGAATNSALGSPFQAGGNIGNTGFAINGTLPAFATTPTFRIDQTIPGTTNAVSVSGSITGRGGSTITTGQVSVATSATLIAAARTSRQKITLSPTSSVVYYVGAAAVTTTTGMYVPAGASITLDTAAAVYAVGTATVTITFAEFY